MSRAAATRRGDNQSRRTPMTRFLVTTFLAVAMLFTLACAETDPGITTAVKSRLTADDTVKAYQIDVDTNDRVVTLTGAVDTAAAKTQAVAIARQTDGVREVVDQITVSPKPTATTGDRRDDAADRTTGVATDAAVTSAVKTKLLADTAVSGLKIDVDTKNGVVTLNGNVASKSEADRAMSLARDTNGVKEVVNNLRVKG
jgi:hyperosmotically inducible periplasmic protein